MTEKTCTGMILGDNWSKPVIGKRVVYGANNQQKEISSCRFKMVCDGQQGAEPVTVFVDNPKVAQYICAGRRVFVTGEAIDNPRYNVKDGKISAYVNPTIYARRIMFMDTPLGKQVDNVLAIMKEADMLTEENLEVYSKTLHKIAELKFNESRIEREYINENNNNSKSSFMVETPPKDADDDLPL